MLSSPIQSLKDAHLEATVKALELALANNPDMGTIDQLQTVIRNCKNELTSRHATHLDALDSLDIPDGNCQDSLEHGDYLALCELFRKADHFSLIICGAPTLQLLGIIRCLCTNSERGAYVLRDSGAKENRLIESINHCNEGGTILIYPIMENRGSWPQSDIDFDSLLSLSNDNNARVVILYDRSLDLMPEANSRNWPCLLIDIQHDKTSQIKTIDSIMERCGPGLSRNAKAALRAKKNIKSLVSLENILNSVNDGDQNINVAITNMALRGMNAKASRRNEEGKSEKKAVWIAPQEYSIELLNTSLDPNLILEMIKMSQENNGIRLLFCGPSGTGKTELAKFCASRLSISLLQYRADELLWSKLGDSERAFHKIFREANEDKGILFLDEFENFVLQRSNKSNSSITEMLTTTMLSELDQYRGILIACTNHLEFIDKAMLRRFSVTVNFSPLRSYDRVEAYNKYLREFGGELSSVNLVLVNDLNGLSLGDIGNIKRRMELLWSIQDVNRPGQSEIVKMLVDQVAARVGQTSARIGFDAN